MTLSKSVEDSLKEAESNLRNALAFAARQERPLVCGVISELISKIDSVIKKEWCFSGMPRPDAEARYSGIQ